MYLVSPDHFSDTKQLAHPPTSIEKKASHKPAPRHKRKEKKRHVTAKLHPYDKWVMTRKNIKETDVKREALRKEIAKFLGRLLPKHTPLQTFPTKNEPLETSVRTTRHLEKETVPLRPSTSSPSSDVLFGTPKKAVVEIQDDDDDDATEEEEKVKLFSRKHYGAIASPFLSPYLKDSRLLDTQTVSEEKVISL